MTVAYARPHVKLVCIRESGTPESHVFNIHWEKSGVWHRCLHPYHNTPELLIGVDVLSDILSLPPIPKYSGKKFQYNSEDRYFYWKNQKLVSSRVYPDLAIRIREFILSSILQRI